MTGKLFIISAPSGAGKSTLVTAVLQGLQKEWPIDRVITYTTKQPRHNEQNGKDYHFIETSDFEQRISQGFFLEWSNAYSTYYGSPRSIIDQRAKGHSFILIIDRVGAKLVKEQVTDATLIWIEAPSMAELKRRLSGRGTETRDQIDKRLKQAQIEIDQEQSNPLYDHSIRNGDFGVAKKELKEVILRILSK